MRNATESALETLFADPNIGVEAVYIADGGTPLPVRVVARRADAITDFGDARLTIHAVYLPRPRIEISGPQGVQATFDWQAARDAVVGRMCTATLINSIGTY